MDVGGCKNTSSRCGKFTLKKGSTELQYTAAYFVTLQATHTTTQYLRAEAHETEGVPFQLLEVQQVDLVLDLERKSSRAHTEKKKRRAEGAGHA